MAQFTLIVMWPLGRPPPSERGQILINGHKTGSGTKVRFCSREQNRTFVAGHVMWPRSIGSLNNAVLRQLRVT